MQVGSWPASLCNPPVILLKPFWLKNSYIILVFETLHHLVSACLPRSSLCHLPHLLHSLAKLPLIGRSLLTPSSFWPQGLCSCSVLHLECFSLILVELTPVLPSGHSSRITSSRDLLFPLGQLRPLPLTLIISPAQLSAPISNLFWVCLPPGLWLQEGSDLTSFAHHRIP